MLTRTNICCTSLDYSEPSEQARLQREPRSAPMTASGSRSGFHRVVMIANLLEGMEHEEAARLAGLSRSAAYEWHNR
jgi:DNA-directed RNA polymerase specialized sigma24 family protein